MPRGGTRLGDWVFFGRPEQEPFSMGFAALSVGGAVLGLGAAYRLYARWRERDPLRSLGPAYVLLERNYFIDDLYLRGIISPIQYKVSAAVHWFDRRVLDGIVHGVVLAIRRLADAVHVVDERVIDGAVNGVARASSFLGGTLRYIQSGNLQRYALFLFAGLIVLAVVFTRI